MAVKTPNKKQNKIVMPNVDIEERAKQLAEVMLKERLAEIEAKKKAEYEKLQSKADGLIQTAFEWKGIAYYHFPDPFNAMAGRGLCISEFYSELEMKCSREFLQAHVTAVRNILNDRTKLDLPELIKLYNQLQERLDMIVTTDTILKLASVVYFDANENPYNYDVAYNIEKIRNWKKDEGFLAFFLSRPIKELIPSINLSENDLLDYLKTEQKITNKHLENIFTMLSEPQKNKEWYRILSLLRSTD